MRIRPSPLVNPIGSISNTATNCSAKRLENSKTIPGKDKVIYPGLSEHKTQIERIANGIPIHNEVLDWFKKINKELKVSNKIN